MKPIVKNRIMKKKDGYTMLEILAVVGILMIVVTMAIPSLTRVKRHATETAAIQGLRAIVDAEELYYDVGGYYTAGGNQMADLRNVDAIDSGSFGASASQGVFIKGYSLVFSDIGTYPQNYSVYAIPIQQGMGLRTFWVIADGTVRDAITDEPV